jgi:hypothetical protein
VKNKFQLSSFITTLMPFLVFIALALFSVSGGLLDVWIAKEKVLCLASGSPRWLWVCLPSKIRNRSGDLSSGQ